MKQYLEHLMGILEQAIEDIRNDRDHFAIDNIFLCIDSLDKKIQEEEIMEENQSKREELDEKYKSI